MFEQTKTFILLVCFGLLSLAYFDSTAQTTEFTYQGELNDGLQPANGQYDFEFKLYSSETDGSQVGDTVSLDNVLVTAGIFTVSLDFGDDASNFNGSRRWLEIAVRPGASSNPADFVTLAPRQLITAAPYSLHTRGIFVSDDGDVGIGTNSPLLSLQVSRTGPGLSNPTATIGVHTLESVLPVSPEGWVYLKNTIASSSLRRESGTPLYIGTEEEIGGSLTSQLIISSSGNVGIGAGVPAEKLHVGGNAKIDGNAEISGHAEIAGMLGVGTSMPSAKIHVVGGLDSEPNAGGYLVLGEFNDYNISLDNNEIMARVNGEASTLHLNNNGDIVAIGANSGGSIMVGIGTEDPSERLDLGGGNIDMGYEIVEDDTNLAGIRVDCPPGKRVIGGGCREYDHDEWILESYPVDGVGWHCRFDTMPEGENVRAYAICANIR